MLFSNSLIRRYTPPTCTLEIWGKRSISSLWTTHKRLNDFKFKLLFDDPKMLDDEQITLEGDRSELQLLCDIVITYVQNLLASSPSSLSLMGCATSSALSPKVLISSYSVTSGFNVYPQQRQLNGKEQVTTSAADFTVSEPTILDKRDNFYLSGVPLPSLKPKGLLTHELDCSLLITTHNKTKIQLSISQLFDLVNALEQYSLEAEISPDFESPKPTKKIVVWTITALVALVAVGIPTVGIKWYNWANQETALDDSSSQLTNSNIKDILPPVPLPPPNASAPSPTLAPSLEQQKKLLPPSQVGQVTPPSRNPSVAVVIPPKPVLPPAPVVPPDSQRNTIVLTPNLPPTPTSSTSPSLSTLPTHPRPNSVPTLSNSPIKSANTAYAMPYTTAAPTLPRLPNLPSQPTTVQPEPHQSQLTAINSANSPTNKSNTVLLDTIPQVTEAREYFQQRWQPPESLKHTLEYRLVLNPDGSIGRIIPLGKAAKIYLDRTNMPLMGEPFVSAPPETLENPQIRLVLSPDKTVKTFLEDSQVNLVSN